MTKFVDCGDEIWRHGVLAYRQKKCHLSLSKEKRNKFKQANTIKVILQAKNKNWAKRVSFRKIQDGSQIGHMTSRIPSCAITKYPISQTAML